MSNIEVSSRHGFYRYSLDEPNLDITLDRFPETPRSLFAEVRVRVDGEHKLRGASDLLSPNAKATLSKRMRELYTDTAWVDPWDKIIEWVSEDAIRRLREGEPVTDIGNRALRETPKWRLYPIVPEQMPALLFGAGGALKSWMAMAMALCVKTGEPLLGWQPIQGNVLWCDYEMTVDEINERMMRLQAGLGIAPGQQVVIRYKYCDRPLADLVPELLQEIAENKIKLLVLDSLIAAISGSSFTDENIRPLFQALRVLGVAVLIISHVNQQQKRDNSTNDRSTYGNIFIENWVRQMFDVRADTDGSNPRPVVLINTKPNLIAKLRPMAYEVEFDDEIGDVSIRRRDLTSMPSDVSSHIPLGFRILELLRHNEMDLAAIVEETGGTQNAVSKRLTDLKKGGHVINLSRGTWALTTHE